MNYFDTLIEVADDCPTKESLGAAGKRWQQPRRWLRRRFHRITRPSTTRHGPLPSTWHARRRLVHVGDVPDHVEGDANCDGGEKAIPTKESGLNHIEREAGEDHQNARCRNRAEQEAVLADRLKQ